MILCSIYEVVQVRVIVANVVDLKWLLVLSQLCLLLSGSIS
jgi:hypothetical protein